MEKPGRFAMLDLAAAAPPEPDTPSPVRCDLAKAAYNSAHRGKVVYQSLVFFLVVVLVVAAIYAVILFKDDESSKGLLAAITAVGSLTTTGFLGVQASNAAKDEDKMWTRVEKYCD
jgi:hypothetical protein